MPGLPNIFEETVKVDDEARVAEQKKYSGVYLVLLIVAVVVLSIFYAIQTEVAIIKLGSAATPVTYDQYKDNKEKTLTCPCKKKAIQSKTFGTYTHESIWHCRALNKWVTNTRKNTVASDDGSRFMYSLSKLCKNANDMQVALTDSIAESYTISESALDQELLERSMSNQAETSNKINKVLFRHPSDVSGLWANRNMHKLMRISYGSPEPTSADGSWDFSEVVSSDSSSVKEIGKGGLTSSITLNAGATAQYTIDGSVVNPTSNIGPFFSGPTVDNCNCMADFSCCNGDDCCDGVDSMLRGSPNDIKTTATTVFDATVACCNSGTTSVSDTENCTIAQTAAITSKMAVGAQMKRWEACFMVDFYTDRSTAASDQQSLQYGYDTAFIASTAISVNYENYFAQCAPDTCFYELVRTRSAISILTTLIGLIGGLQALFKGLIGFLLGKKLKGTTSAKAKDVEMQ